jgi:protein-disulfide isomerase
MLGQYGMGWGCTRVLVIAVLLALGIPVQVAAQSPGKADSDAELVRRIRDAVIKELRESGALDREIDQGVERYVTRQRAAAAQREETEARSLAGKVRPVSKTRDHIRGNPDAPVSLIEYSDFECPYCKHFHATAKEIVEKYGGKVNWVFRNFPLEFHDPAAQREAEAAECVARLGGNDAYWRYADMIYARTASNGKGVPGGELPKMAASIGVDQSKFTECLDSGQTGARVKEDLAEGVAIGINGTPGNVLRNNRTGAVVTRHGAQPIQQFTAPIDTLLK